MKTKKLLESHKTHTKPSKLEYTKIIGILGVITLLALNRLYDTLKSKAYWYTVGICTFLGWGWNLLIVNFDPVYNAWWYRSQSILGIHILNVPLEDWLFYPICGKLFLCVMVLIPRRMKPTKYNAVHACVSFSFLFVSMVFYFFDVCGISLVLFFGVIAFFAFNELKYFDFRHWGICMIIFHAFSGIWDFFFQQWHYISEINGQVFHSAVFHDYPIGWIGHVPMSIFPYFTLAGCMMIYSIFYKLWDKESTTFV